MIHGVALTVPEPGPRAELGTFVGRVVQLDPVAAVRLCGAAGTVTAWVVTPFEVLATRTVVGELQPADVTVAATALLTALTVDRGATVDPGSEGRWRGGELPPADGWTAVGKLAADELAAATEHGLDEARTQAGPHGPPAVLLDRTVFTVAAPTGPPVQVPLRCLFALSGLGLLPDSGAHDPVQLGMTRSWLRLDTPGGGVARSRRVTLPLLV